MAVVAGLPIESVLALMLTLGRGGPTNESREVTEAEHELGGSVSNSMAGAEVRDETGSRARTSRVCGGPGTKFANQELIVLKTPALLTPPRLQDGDLEVLECPAGPQLFFLNLAS